jgi:L,D-peptidoglycan transpeptidase YkuD (ErfK/YbiS/YcfS/YnhG family)
LPSHTASAESLWLESHAYDIIVVIEFNTDPVVPGAGSAIFLHVASEDFGPTAGCVALRKQDLEAVLRQCSAETKILIRTGRASRVAQQQEPGGAAASTAAL